MKIVSMLSPAPPVFQLMTGSQKCLSDHAHVPVKRILPGGYPKTVLSKPVLNPRDQLSTSQVAFIP